MYLFLFGAFVNVFHVHFGTFISAGGYARAELHLMRIFGTGTSSLRSFLFQGVFDIFFRIQPKTTFDTKCEMNL